MDLAEGAAIDFSITLCLGKHCGNSFVSLVPDESFPQWYHTS